MGTEVPFESELFAAFRDLAAGRGVQRGRHHLFVGGRNRTPLFLDALKAEGFEALTVREAPVEPDHRAPAFVVRDGWAEFGWVFWEKSREGRARKLFGSARRNGRGDWDVQIGVGSRESVYVNVAARLQMATE